tara:strand:- start:483 stop:1004 length:522 start_codon:yes stop_codon:yes gene_type:complete
VGVPKPEVTAKVGALITALVKIVVVPNEEVINLLVSVIFASASVARAPMLAVIAKVVVVTLASASGLVVPKLEVRDVLLRVTLASASVESELVLELMAKPTKVALASASIVVAPTELETARPDVETTAPATTEIDPKAEVVATPVTLTSIDTDKGCPQEPCPQVPLPQPLDIS